MLKLRARLGRGASYLLILLFCFLFALPVLSMLGTSLKTSSDALSTVSLFPSPGKTYFGNFAQVMRDASFERNLWNSFIVSIASTFASVAVASLAGLPASVISRARQIMARLEVSGQDQNTIGKNILDKRKNAGNRQVGLGDYRPMELIEQLRAVDVMGMTPVEALNLLFKLTEQARRI